MILPSRENKWILEKMEDAQLDKKVKVQHETQQGQSLEGNHPANPDLLQPSRMIILKPAQHQEGRDAPYLAVTFLGVKCVCVCVGGGVVTEQSTRPMQVSCLLYKRGEGGQGRERSKDTPGEAWVKGHLWQIFIP